MKLFLATILLVASFIGSNCNEQFTKSDCCKPGQTGREACLAAYRRYQFDCKTNKCVPFIYGGCNASNNNFKTLEECEKVTTGICTKNFTKKDCTEPFQHSPYCEALFYVYTWDHQLKACLKTVYGGCNASNNNFETLEECNKIAGKICSN